MKETGVCEICGTAYNYYSQSEAGRFCSTRCHGLSLHKDIGDLLDKRVDKSGDCWIWTGAINDSGYGVLRHAQKTRYVHRLAWEQVGPPPAHLDKILHTCDTPACVRNDDVGTYEVRGISYERRGHLFIGTVRTNNHDMVDKGRHRGFRVGNTAVEKRWRRGVTLRRHT